jgi:DNA-binding transcriptional MocR family regulator
MRGGKRLKQRPAGEGVKRKRKRIPREKRLKREGEHIQHESRKGKGVTLKQLAARYHVSISTVRRDIKTLQRRLRRKHIRIRLVDRRLFYIKLEKEQAKVQRLVIPKATQTEVHAYLNYSAENGRNAIDIDIVKVVPNNQQAILAAVEGIRDLVAHRFNSTKLGNMMKYGTSPATPQSSNHCLYRHGQGEWREFWGH